jgi:hypothetical protein
MSCRRFHGDSLVKSNTRIKETSHSNKFLDYMEPSFVTVSPPRAQLINHESAHVQRDPLLQTSHPEATAPQLKSGEGESSAAVEEEASLTGV